MNASFPYVSPAVDLPTDPPRRVVDAGYYDNYGVGVAAGWIYHFRDWLRENTGGVVLIQVRDSKSQYWRRHLTGDEERGQSDLARRWSTSLQWVTGPPAGALAARASVTSFRNDEQLQALSDYFNEPGEPGEDEFFTTVVFERPGEVGMNWYLSQADQDDIVQGLDREFEKGRNPNPGALASLVEWWNGGR
jgi:hypothetical protein